MGGAEDAAALKESAPGHSRHFSPAAHAGCGGVAVAIRDGWPRPGARWEADVVSAGRCLGLTCEDPLFPVAVLCLHVDTAVDGDRQRMQLESALGWLGGRSTCMQLLAGDFIFVVIGERRLKPAARATSQQADPLALWWQGHAAHLAEIYQPDYTRRGMRDGKVEVLSPASA